MMKLVNTSETTNHDYNCKLIINISLEWEMIHLILYKQSKFVKAVYILLDITNGSGMLFLQKLKF